MHSITYSEDGSTLFAAGEFDHSNTACLADAIAAHCSRNPYRAVLDLSGITFLDTSGIAVLIRARLRRGAPLLVQRPSAVVRSLLRITGLTEVLLDDTAES